MYRPTVAASVETAAVTESHASAETAAAEVHVLTEASVETHVLLGLEHTLQASYWAT